MRENKDQKNSEYGYFSCSKTRPYAVVFKNSVNLPLLRFSLQTLCHLEQHKQMQLKTVTRLAYFSTDKFHVSLPFEFLYGY